MADCFKELGDTFTQVAPDARALAPKLEKDVAFNLGFGVVTKDTGFARKLSVSKRYKGWVQRRGMPWASKGNHPLAYERDFLKTLAQEDFVGLQGLVPAEVAKGATAVGASFEAEIAKRFAIKPGMALYKAEMASKAATDAASKAGLRVNTDYIQATADGFTKTMHSLEKEIKAVTGEFRIGSADELAAQLRKDGVVLGKTPTGRFEVTNDMLEKASKKNPLWGKVLEWRQAQKRRGMILRLQTETKAGRIHTTYDSLQTATGRIQSGAPNMKQLPPELKKAIIPDPGKKFLEVDWHQQEMRILAGQADVRVWKEAFAAGIDLHAATAAEVYGVSIEQVTPAMRQAAKVVNLGQMYGQTAYSAAKALGISEVEAEAIISKYHKAIPELGVYQKRVGDMAIKNKKALTAFGRERDLTAEIQSDLDKARRQAVNTEGQGTGADMLKMSIEKLAPEAKNGIEMVNFMDDAILFQIPEKMEANAALLRIRKAMEIEFKGVKMEVEGKVGHNWGEMDKVTAPVVEKTAKYVRPSIKVAEEFKSAEGKKELGSAGPGMNETVVVQTGDKKWVRKTSAQREAAAEAAIYDLSEELGMGIVPPTGLVGSAAGGGVTVQEFVGGGKTLVTYKQPFDIIGKALGNYLETKEGRDWVLLDFLTGQADRHGHNFMFKYADGKVSNLKLIDNGMSFNSVSYGGPGRWSTLGDIWKGEELLVDVTTQAFLKGFLSRMGWVEGAVDWKVVSVNVEAYFEKYGVASAKSFVERVKKVVENGFKIRKDWQPR